MKALQAFLLFAIAGCATPTDKVHRMYTSLREEARVDSPSETAERAKAERQHERVLTVRELVAKGPFAEARPNLEAAVLLLASDEASDLALAEKLGLEAARLGENLGFRVAAEAVDKQAIKQGKPQRYGTQYAYDASTRRWRVFPCDPLTTDAERRAMGVPSYAEILAGEQKLNERAASGHR
jgi:hypothetical protein